MRNTDRIGRMTFVSVACRHSQPDGQAPRTAKTTPDQGYFLDPFEMTRQLVKDEFLPALPAGVSKARTVAACRRPRSDRQVSGETVEILRVAGKRSTARMFTVAAGGEP